MTSISKITFGQDLATIAQKPQKFDGARDAESVMGAGGVRDGREKPPRSWAKFLTYTTTAVIVAGAALAAVRANVSSINKVVLEKGGFKAAEGWGGKAKYALAKAGDICLKPYNWVVGLFKGKEKVADAAKDATKTATEGTKAAGAAAEGTKAATEAAKEAVEIVVK